MQVGDDRDGEALKGRNIQRDVIFVQAKAVRLPPEAIEQQQRERGGKKRKKYPANGAGPRRSELDLGA
jgi:hypothetical protein